MSPFQLAPMPFSVTTWAGDLAALVKEDEVMELITAQEVAAMLKVPVARVYELARTNILPSVHLGRRQLRFDQARLREWIECGGDSKRDPSTDDLDSNRASKLR